MKFLWNLRNLLRKSVEYVRVSAEFRKTKVDVSSLGKVYTHTYLMEMFESVLS